MKKVSLGVHKTVGCRVCKKLFSFEQRGRFERIYCDDCRKIGILTRRRNEIINRLGGKCLICPENRRVEVAHIIPNRFFYNIEGLEVLSKQESMENIIALCPSHHSFYDYFLLTEAEKTMILDKIGREKINKIINAFFSVKIVDEMGNEAPKDCWLVEIRKREERAFNKWLERFKIVYGL